MRRILYITLFLLLVQQLKAQQTSLVGTYQVDLIKTLELMEGEWKQKYDGLEAPAKERANLSMADRVFVFHDNGQIEVRWKVNGTDKTATGTWELKEEDKLIIKIGEQTTQYTVSRPTNSDLVLKNASGKGFFNNLYLLNAG